MKKLRDCHIIDRARDFLCCWKRLASGAHSPAFWSASVTPFGRSLSFRRPPFCTAHGYVPASKRHPGRSTLFVRVVATQP